MPIITYFCIFWYQKIQKYVIIGTMERVLLKKLIDWKESKFRQPLILKGARQVGKTYLLKQFGKQCFKRFHYFNFEESDDLKDVFVGNLNVDQILQNLRLDRSSVENNQELIIFDEIQQCPRAINSLKYFAENAPKIYICSAGSLIGVTLAEESFPVGKVDYLYLTPLKFDEYLKAVDPWLYDIFDKILETKADDFQHKKLLSAFNDYSIVGGLPRGILIARELANQKNDFYRELKDFHDSMIRTYQSDFAKHAGKVNAVHIANIFSNIPSQLSANIDGSTKRFKFKDAVPGLRGYADLEGPISWLVKAGLVYKVKIAKKSLFPIESFTEDNIFKLYIFDTGLLIRMLKIPYDLVLKDSYGMHKGFVVENLILSQLTNQDLDYSYCWRENKAEVDFLKIIQDKLVPIEVKSNHRTASKSLASYIMRYNPDISITLSTNNFSYNKDKKIWNIPLYCSKFLGDEVLVQNLFR